MDNGHRSRLIPTDPGDHPGTDPTRLIGAGSVQSLSATDPAGISLACGFCDQANGSDVARCGWCGEPMERATYARSRL